MRWDLGALAAFGYDGWIGARRGLSRRPGEIDGWIGKVLMGREYLTRSLPELWQDRRFRKMMLGGAGALVGLGAALAGSLAGYALFHEPLHVRLDQLTVYLPNATGRLPAAGLRILHLSDSHFQGHDWREQAKIESIRRLTAGLDYDLLVHTGDFLHYDSGLANVEALMDVLPAPRLASFAVLGNHDYTRYSHNKLLTRAWTNFLDRESLRRQSVGLPSTATNVERLLQLLRFGGYFLDVPLDLRRTGRNDVARLEATLAQRGVTILHNRSTRLCHAPGTADAVDIVLAGVDDVTEGSPNVAAALAYVRHDAPTILLSHNPDILDEPGLEQVDLILAGHTHGGQIVLPLFGPAHTQSTHLARHEVSGYLRRGATQVYITRGIGEGIPLRFGAHPQITLISVMAEEIQSKT